MKNIGFTLKSIRVERGFTLRQLAEVAEVPYSYLSNIENGKATPGIDVIDRICFALNVSVSQAIIKTDLERNIDQDRRKLIRDLMPYFRKMDAIAKKIYGDNANDLNNEDEDDVGDGQNIKPIISGGGQQKLKE